MLTKSMIRKPGRVLAVLTVVVSLSGLAEAQQSGIFPLRPIRRERTPCVNEDSIYKQYRNQYYGYFPTQWRKFPDGWNLPSSEGPNTKQVLKDNPIEGPKPSPSGEGEGEDMPGPNAPGGKPAIPNPPPDTERSPFEMDRPDNAVRPTPGAGAPRRRPPGAQDNAPAPGSEPSPSDTPDGNPPGAGAAPGPRPRAPQPNRPTTPTIPDAGTPDLAPPGNAPTPPPQTSRNGNQRQDRETDSAPLLAMSDATLPTVEEASSPADPAGGAALQPVATDPGAAGPALPPVAAPSAPRRGRLSSLFGGLGLNWMRR
jgi:hypothetical protein